MHTFIPGHDVSTATVRVDTTHTGGAISRHITGKFCEHLGANIYNGMHAQILRNPTFADWPFGSAGHPDGGVTRTDSERKVAATIRKLAERLEWPDPRRLVEARRDGLAHWWIREGSRTRIRFSPDTATHGQRAQRVELSAAEQGIAQWVCLPLHRVRRYEYSLRLRTSRTTELHLRLESSDGTRLSQQPVTVDADWRTRTGIIEVPASVAHNARLKLTLTSTERSQFVVARAELYPADHVHGCDPDIIRLLRQSRLPILRWPGGNFVSGYHWRDGVGPIDERPSRDNPAWATIEPNLFGTDEFVQYCRDVDTEPMICVNAGSGTPGEAADWVEYCNGSVDTPMGKLRAAHGHPDPYDVKVWEIGNELYGRWQVRHTTPHGYADRFVRFADAMRERDPSILLLANGAPLFFGGHTAWPEQDGSDWNRTLVKQAAGKMQWITDHLLLGGRLPVSADPLDVYRDFMTYPDNYTQAYEQVQGIMRDAGIAEPRLAITELQLFGSLQKPTDGDTDTLTRENLVTPDTMAEAVYLTLWYHAACRLHPFIGMLTHSATVNHGGGLRKVRETVYANPVFHARSMFTDFTETPLCGVTITCATEPTAGVCSGVTRDMPVPVLSAVAAKQADAVLVSLAHRGTRAPMRVTLDLGHTCGDGKAEITQLTAPQPWDRNTVEQPESIAPVCSQAHVNNGRLTLDLPRYSVAVVRVAL